MATHIIYGYRRVCCWLGYYVAYAVLAEVYSQMHVFCMLEVRPLIQIGHLSKQQSYALCTKEGNSRHGQVRVLLPYWKKYC